MNRSELLILADSSRGRNLSADGSSFDVIFDTPIQTPKAPTLRLLSANIWYTFPNINSENNLLDLNYGTSMSALTNLQVLIPKGLYGVDELNSAIEYAIAQDGLAGDALGADSVTLVPDYATGKAQLRLSVANGVVTILQVDWDTSTIGALLGFTAGGQSTLSSGVTRQYTGATVANFAPISSLQVHCDACRGSSVNGSSGSDVMAEVSLDAAAGRQILHRPFHTPRVRSDAFLGGISRIRLTLTDQTGQPVDTQSEYWTVSMLLEW